MKRHYEPFYYFRMGRRVLSVLNSRMLNLYLAEDPEPPPEPPDDEPAPPPEPPDDDPLPPPEDDEPLPLPEPDDDPTPPPPDPDPYPHDYIRMPGVLVLSQATEQVVSQRGLFWFEVNEEKIGAWDIESVEHLRLTILNKIEPWHGSIAFNIPMDSEHYETVKALVIRHGGVVFE